jgi:hypothetical protein
MVTLDARHIDDALLERAQWRGWLEHGGGVAGRG